MSTDDEDATEEELREYAGLLGIDPDKEPDLMWIAHKGITAPLPENWKPIQTKDGDIYFFNYSTGESNWEHPLDDELRELVKQERACAKADVSTSQTKRLNPVVTTPQPLPAKPLALPAKLPALKPISKMSLNPLPPVSVKKPIKDPLKPAINPVATTKPVTMVQKDNDKQQQLSMYAKVAEASSSSTTARSSPPKNRLTEPSPVDANPSKDPSLRTLLLERPKTPLRTDVLALAENVESKKGSKAANSNLAEMEILEFENVGDEHETVSKKEKNGQSMIESDTESDIETETGSDSKRSIESLSKAQKINLEDEKALKNSPVVVEKNNDKPAAKISAQTAKGYAGNHQENEKPVVSASTTKGVFGENASRPEPIFAESKRIDKLHADETAKNKLNRKEEEPEPKRISVGRMKKSPSIDNFGALIEQKEHVRERSNSTSSAMETYRSDRPTKAHNMQHKDIPFDKESTALLRKYEESRKVKNYSGQGAENDHVPHSQARNQRRKSVGSQSDASLFSDVMGVVLPKKGMAFDNQFQKHNFENQHHDNRRHSRSRRRRRSKTSITERSSSESRMRTVDPKLIQTLLSQQKEIFYAIEDVSRTVAMLQGDGSKTRTSDDVENADESRMKKFLVQLERKLAALTIAVDGIKDSRQLKGNQLPPENHMTSPSEPVVRRSLPPNLNDHHTACERALQQADTYMKQRAKLMSCRTRSQNEQSVAKLSQAIRKLNTNPRIDRNDHRRIATVQKSVYDVFDTVECLGRTLNLADITTVANYRPNMMVDHQYPAHSMMQYNQQRSNPPRPKTTSDLRDSDHFSGSDYDADMRLASLKSWLRDFEARDAAVEMMHPEDQN